ncbi:hypothetical protein, partial [Dialister sp.]|uniref:hypothetical protein n=1 Tax=Dialister sp. TaxID=1955814 RepID=UPI0025D4EFBB
WGPNYTFNCVLDKGASSFEFPPLLAPDPVHLLFYSPPPKTLAAPYAPFMGYNKEKNHLFGGMNDLSI